MRINHNIQALNAYRNLNNTANTTAKSLEKLSSGLRINRAADDAAGLAISEKMRSQIRGLDMAERNSLDAISLIQTAEGALSSTHEILQRMRELSVQAANGTLEDKDREAIQDEINQLTYEIDRISDTTQFNQKKLLNGSEQGRAFTETASDQIQYAENGTFKGIVTAEPSAPAKVNIGFDENFANLNAAGIEGTTFTINGKTYEIETGTTPGITGDNIAVNVSWTDGAATTAERADNINNLMNSLKSAIDANEAMFFNVTQENAADVAGTLQNGLLKIETKQNMSPSDVKNMESDYESVSTTVPAGISFLNPADNTTTTELIADTDAVLAEITTLAFSDVPKDGDQLKIDGLTITFKDTTTVPVPSPTYTTGGTAEIFVTGKDLGTVLNEIKQSIDSAKNAVPDAAPALNASYSIVGRTLTFGTTKTDDGLTTGVTNGLEIEFTDNDFEANKGKPMSLNFQIGANESESLTVSLDAVDAASLGIAREADGTTPSAAGAKASKGVSVATTELASQAITIFDEAIKKVSQQRSKLGAFQNRLDHTITNLQTASENLTASESRIRDLDMAKEMTNFTRNNILNQAGQAMLAQANQLPQGVLQLLQ